MANFTSINSWTPGDNLPAVEISPETHEEILGQLLKLEQVIGWAEIICDSTEITWRDRLSRLTGIVPRFAGWPIADATLVHNLIAEGLGATRNTHQITAMIQAGISIEQTAGDDEFYFKKICMCLLKAKIAREEALHNYQISRNQLIDSLLGMIAGPFRH